MGADPAPAVVAAVPEAPPSGGTPDVGFRVIKDWKNCWTEGDAVNEAEEPAIPPKVAGLVEETGGDPEFVRPCSIIIIIFPFDPPLPAPPPTPASVKDGPSKPDEDPPPLTLDFEVKCFKRPSTSSASNPFNPRPAPRPAEEAPVDSGGGLLVW